MPYSAYKPTLREIVSEMTNDFAYFVQDIKHSVTDIALWDDLKNFSPDWHLIGKDALRVAGFYIMAPYGVFTARRKLNEATGEIDKLGGFIGLMGALYFHSLTLIVYSTFPQAFAFPTATNIALGIYEWRRSARKRLTERHSPTSLADIVDN